MQIAAASAPFLDSLRPRFRALASEPAGEDLVLPGHDYRKVELRRFQGVKNEFLHASALTTVEAEFGRLEPADFERLHRQFGGRSQVAYDASRSYTVRDFLPPALRARSIRIWSCPNRSGCRAARPCRPLRQKKTKPST